MHSQSKHILKIISLDVHYFHHIGKKKSEAMYFIPYMFSEYLTMCQAVC